MTDPDTRYLRPTIASQVPMRRQREWGPWQLDPDTAELVHTDPIPGTAHTYAVDLDGCRTPAQVLDWITQVAAKTWADDATTAGLVRALDDLLNMQGSLCPSGRTKTLTRTQLRTRIATWDTP